MVHPGGQLTTDSGLSVSIISFAVDYGLWTGDCGVKIKSPRRFSRGFQSFPSDFSRLKAGSYLELC